MSSLTKRTIAIGVLSVNKGVLRVTDSRDVVTDIYHVYSSVGGFSDEVASPFGFELRQILDLSTDFINVQR